MDMLTGPFLFNLLYPEVEKADSWAMPSRDVSMRPWTLRPSSSNRVLDYILQYDYGWVTCYYNMGALREYYCYLFHKIRIRRKHDLLQREIV